MKKKIGVFLITVITVMCVCGCGKKDNTEILKEAIASETTAVTEVIEDNSIVIGNDTGMKWIELKVAPTGTDTWGNNMIEGMTVYDGTDGTLTFSGVKGGTLYDIQITDTDNMTFIWSGVDLAGLDSVKITFNSEGLPSIEENYYVEETE